MPMAVCRPTLGRHFSAEIFAQGGNGRRHFFRTETDADKDAKDYD